MQVLGDGHGAQVAGQQGLHLVLGVALRAEGGAQTLDPPLVFGLRRLALHRGEFVGLVLADDLFERAHDVVIRHGRRQGGRYMLLPPNPRLDRRSAAAHRHAGGAQLGFDFLRDRVGAAPVPDVADLAHPARQVWNLPINCARARHPRSLWKGW
ncbi:hypothetical protein D3C71_1426520 [compost metagenome]